MQLNPTTVKSLRHTFDWTQQQLADACDVSLRTIQRVEKEGAASKETTMALCAVFEVRQGELIKLDENSQNDANNSPSKSFIAGLVISSVISFALGAASVLLVSN